MGIVDGWKCCWCIGEIVPNPASWGKLFQPGVEMDVDKLRDSLSDKILCSTSQLDLPRRVEIVTKKVVVISGCDGCSRRLRKSHRKI